MRLKILAFALLFIPCAIWAQAPSYISSMSAYQVRALTGAYTPTNGDEAITDATTAEWISSDPAGGCDLPCTILAWSGGYKASSGTRLIYTGGGHDDSANNGRLAFDFAGTTAPTGWVVLTRSTVANVINNAAAYADGLPTSIHTYDGCVYASHNDHLYNFMGSNYATSGGHSAYSWKYNIGTNTWTQLTDYPGGGYHAPATIYDPVSGKIWVSSEGDSFSSRFFRTADDTWSGAKALTESLVPDMSGAYDTSRGRGVLVSGTATYLVTVDFSAETVNTSDITPTGDTEVLDDGLSIVYDSDQDVFWLWGGQGGNEGYTGIYSMHPTTWAITRNAFTGDTFTFPPAGLGNTQGSFGRWVYMSAYRAIGFVTDIDTPAYVIRLPGEPDPPAVSGNVGRLRLH